MEVCSLKMADFIFLFLAFLGLKSHVFAIFNFSGQLGKSDENENGLEFYCGHFELSWRSVA